MFEKVAVLRDQLRPVVGSLWRPEKTGDMPAERAELAGLGSTPSATSSAGTVR